MRLLLIALLLHAGVLVANGARQYYEDQISMESAQQGQETMVRSPPPSGGRHLSHELASIRDKIQSRRAQFGTRIRQNAGSPVAERTESAEVPTY